MGLSAPPGPAQRKLLEYLHMVQAAEDSANATADPLLAVRYLLMPCKCYSRALLQAYQRPQRVSVMAWHLRPKCSAEPMVPTV